MDERVWRSRAAALVEATVSKKRLAHSREVASLACELCERFRCDGDKGYIAGIAHDLAREKSPAELVSLCEGDGLPICEYEKENPLLLHGRASAVLLAQCSGYSDPEVLQAIRDHVAGRGSMGALSRILFAADFLEPTRDFVSPEFRRRTRDLPLDAIVLAVLERKLYYVRAEGRRAVPESLVLYEELKEHAG